MKKESEKSKSPGSLVTMFMCGDVMTGRGIDQVLPYPSVPILYEPYVKNAMEYVWLAEEKNGPIPKPVNFSYIWGDAIAELERRVPDVRVINLETSITNSGDYLKDKSIHYRMNPENISCLTTAKIDCCSLANNHILDWGYSGLTETLETLKRAKVKFSGAGRDIKEAETPAIMEISGKGRIIFFSFGSETSGIPRSWAASKDKPGVNLLKNLSEEDVGNVKEKVKKIKSPKDVVVASIHWGANWGYEVPNKQRDFAHRLIDEAHVDVVYGHSSHHVKGIEVYKNKLILYGCGDFINDYEGISGYEHFRGDLGLMYFASLEPSTGNLFYLHMVPTQIKRFRINRASKTDALWLEETLNREGHKFGTSVELDKDNTLKLLWN